MTSVCPVGATTEAIIPSEFIVNTLLFPIRYKTFHQIDKPDVSYLGHTNNTVAEVFTPLWDTKPSLILQIFITVKEKFRIAAELFGCLLLFKHKIRTTPNE